MAGWRERLAQRARDTMNAAQDAVSRFEQGGGVDGFARQMSDWANTADARIASGRHPLNPDYRHQVRTWYARLELPYGAPAAEVRTAFRALMRKYHPDRFSGVEEQEQLATRLSQELTVAYEGLLEYLGER